MAEWCIFGAVRRAALPVEALLAGEAMLRGEAVPRRLAAILAADVARYARLMEADEEGTLARLKSLRRVLIGRMIALHEGPSVKTTGHGMLVEFASAVEAAPIAAG